MIPGRAVTQDLGKHGVKGKVHWRLKHIVPGCCLVKNNSGCKTIEGSGARRGESVKATGQGNVGGLVDHIRSSPWMSSSVPADFMCFHHASSLILKNDIVGKQGGKIRSMVEGIAQDGMA